jgi:hypothetical protein
MGLTLHDKGGLVKSLWHAVDGASGNLANVPALVRGVIETEAWKKREQDGEIYEHKTFLSFIESPPLAGCGWPPEKVQALIKGEPEIEELWHKATTGKQGAHRDNITMKERQGGTSRAYTLSRLRRERPDLFERVVAGELTPNAAAIIAGWRKPPSPLTTLNNAWNKASEEERTTFRESICG